MQLKMQLSWFSERLPYANDLNVGSFTNLLCAADHCAGFPLRNVASLETIREFDQRFVVH